MNGKTEKGKYLPLSVYERQGFNIKDIEQNCTDTKEDEVLGTTYCVKITSKEEGEIEKEVRKDITSFRVDLNKAMASQGRLETRGQKRAIEDNTENKNKKVKTGQEEFLQQLFKQQLRKQKRGRR